MALLGAAAISACGQDTVPPGPDAPSGNHPPPRVIAGGGIGDGPIDGVANLYVIDDVTRQPISGAAVRIGTLDGTTDAAGLFVAKDVIGPQTVSVKAGTYRSEVWTGANGANMTMNLQKANAATPPAATLTGQITGFGSITVSPGHAKDAIVLYSQTKDLGAPENEIPQSNNSNACFVRTAGQDCPFTIATRTGAIALVAAILDRDLMGTPTDFTDDVLTVIRWAYRGGITASAGTNAGTFDLAVLSQAQTQTITLDMGAVPPYFEASAVVGADVGGAGIVQLAFVLPTASRTVMVPRLDAIGGSSYQLVGIASRASAMEQSIVIRRGLTGTTLSAGAWLPVPGNASVSPSGGSWTNAAGATAHSIEISQGSTRVANLTVFDGATSATIPDLIAIPTGSLAIGMTAIGAPGLVVTDFELDRDRDKLVQLAGKTFMVTR